VNKSNSSHNRIRYDFKNKNTKWLRNSNLSDKKSIFVLGLIPATAGYLMKTEDNTTSKNN
jgi:hypothetical protein